MDFTLSTKPLLPTPVKSAAPFHLRENLTGQAPVKYDKTFNPSTIYKTYGAGAASSKAFYPFLWHLWVIYPVKCLPREIHWSQVDYFTGACPVECLPR
jgi:hypothetical protein